MSTRSFSPASTSSLRIEGCWTLGASNAIADLPPACSDTTATALSWVLYELALHPGAQVRIAEEVHATLAGRAAFEYDDLKQLKYTEMVLKEVRTPTLHANFDAIARKHH